MSFNSKYTGQEVEDKLDELQNLTVTQNEFKYKEGKVWHSENDGEGSGLDADFLDGKQGKQYALKSQLLGRNLLLGSGTEVSNPYYNIAKYWFTEQIPVGTQVTVTIWAELGENCEGFVLFNSGGNVPIDGKRQDVGQSVVDIVNGKGQTTVNWAIENSYNDYTASNTYLSVFTRPFGGSNNSVSTIHKIKLEYGDISTEWTPAWEDLPDLEERYAYGVEWDMASSSPDGVRVGNMQLHRELPVQSKMRRVTIDNNGGITNNSPNSDDVTDGSNSNVMDHSMMTEIPEHWFKLVQHGTKFRMMLSEIPLPGYKHIDKFYVSTNEARIDRNTNTLIASGSPNSANAEYRGGDNTAEWDGTYRSLLGRPVTNLTRDQFRQAARKKVVDGKCTPIMHIKPCFGCLP